MSFNDYTFLDPEDGDVGQDLRRLADRHPARAARLVDWLEDSIKNRASRESCAQEPDVDVFIVPPRFVLSNLPDSAALMRVNHRTKEVDLVMIIELFGGFGEAAHWQEILEIAGSAAKGELR